MNKQVAARFGIVSCNNFNETLLRARDVGYENNATGDLWKVLGDLTQRGPVKLGHLLFYLVLLSCFVPPVVF